MILSEQQLEASRRKLVRLEAGAAAARARLSARPADATRVTLNSYCRLINKLMEEIARYEAGVAPRPKRIVLDESQLRNTRAKLAALESRIQQMEQKPASPAQDLSLVSLRHTMNQLREEIAWSERVVAAFAGNPSGVVKMDGMMLDKPHLRAAEKILAQRRAG